MKLKCIQISLDIYQDQDISYHVQNQKKNKKTKTNKQTKKNKQT